MSDCALAACHVCRYASGDPVHCHAGEKPVPVEFRRDRTGCPIGIFAAGNWMVPCETMKPYRKAAPVMALPKWEEPEVFDPDAWMKDSGGSEGCNCA